MSKPTTKKPHHMASPAAVPCAKCGYEWVRPTLDFSDPDAEEIPIFLSCARCMTRVAEEAESHA